jgi:hypothetical protein
MRQKFQKCAPFSGPAQFLASNPAIGPRFPRIGYAGVAATKSRRPGVWRDLHEIAVKRAVFTPRYSNSSGEQWIGECGVLYVLQKPYLKTSLQRSTNPRFYDTV